MLLGVSIFFKLLCVGQIELGDSLPLLQKSVLGWIVADNYNCSQTNSLHTTSQEINNREEIECLKLSNIIQKFWECEETIKPERLLTKEESECENHFISNLERTSSGRFIVKLPFKNNHCALGSSYDIALRRFLNLEKRLEREANIKDAYSKFIEEYRSLDHLEIVDKSCILKNKNYFMPHHPVLRPDSLSTKFLQIK